MSHSNTQQFINWHLERRFFARLLFVNCAGYIKAAIFQIGLNGMEVFYGLLSEVLRAYLFQVFNVVFYSDAN